MVTHFAIPFLDRRDLTIACRPISAIPATVLENKSYTTDKKKVTCKKCRATRIYKRQITLDK